MSVNSPLEIRFDYSFGDQKEELYFKFKDDSAAPSAECILAAKILPSMLRGEDLLANKDAVDPLFLNSLIDIQEIYHSWNADYKIIKIEAPAKIQQQSTNNGVRCATFFSGGVDSFYTLIKHRPEITDLVFAHGLDIPLEDIELREKTVKMLKKVADHFQVNLIEVETNVRTILAPFAEWGKFAHGVALASIGLLLQGHLSTIYIPSSYTYKELFPWGTHPILDHLWSTSSLKFIHDGCEASRNKKIALLSRYDIVLQSLRVCWLNPQSAYNCGKCPKCIRAMISLEMNNVLEKCSTFDQKLDLKAVARLKLKSVNIRIFVAENIAALERSGEKAPLLKALKKAVRVRNFKKLFKKRYR